MRSWAPTAALLFGVVVATGAEARYVGVYDYPFVSPLAATVAATPPANQARMPSEADLAEIGDTRFLEVFPGRAVPDVFWFYQSGMPYGVFLQERREAPLFFVIGGTGAGHDSAKSRLLAGVLYQAGFHVVSLPSPSHSSFIVTASTYSVPGQLAEDAEDLYRVMVRIRDEVRGEVAVGGTYVGGYSLGGTHAAFVSQVDEREGRLDLRKALVVNPSVSLSNSVRILDDMLNRHLEKDPAAVNDFIDRIFGELSALYDAREEFDSSDPGFLYRAFTFLEPPEQELEMLIGLAFRLTSNDMSFASDVMTNSGYVVPKNAELSATTSLTDVFLSGMGLDFEDYLDGVYLPQVSRRMAGATRERLIAAASLRSIEGYLHGADRVVLVGTADDPILAPGEVAWLESVFGERARIFPTGGHCGSMDQREFVAAMLELVAE